MAAPTIIKSTDSGAPVCNGVIGQAIVLLDYILVAQLGWSKPFSGTNKAVYYPQQKASENRLFYRVEDSQGKGYKLSIYESMADIDNGVLVRDNMWVCKSSTADTTERPWIAIGDAYGIYFRTQHDTAGGISFRTNYMGLGGSYFPSDAWFSIVTGKYYTSTYPISGGDANSFYPPSNEDRVVWRNKDGVVGVTRPSLWGLLGNNGPGNGYPASQNYPWDGTLLYSAPIMQDTVLRGVFPGFYSPYHSGGFTDLQEITTGGTTFIVLFDDQYSSDKILIDIGSGFRP